MRDINRNAPAFCSRTIKIDAPAEVVWKLITGINEWSEWQTDIQDPALKTPLVPGSTFTWKTGGVRIKSTIHTVNPYEHFGWTGKTFGARAIHNWTLTSKGSSTTVTVDESMEGLLVSLFRRKFSQNLEEGMKRWLTFLKDQAEKIVNSRR